MDQTNSSVQHQAKPIGAPLGHTTKDTSPQHLEHETKTTTMSLASQARDHNYHLHNTTPM